ncbi:uncharacterized protein LOC120663859 [Panicum virgatum]|uniref:Uncharacterized protein n=1 Tax=Panicum virgatum TaxID=38727 RepID=A0A8T0U393_PANVG|nr:uncharacterized protein LOC120663859 [Panicum virgatum]KAG2615563.1 hypothetical protein PVAP13_3NG052590 [Panicum virgatum]
MVHRPAAADQVGRVVDQAAATARGGAGRRHQKPAHAQELVLRRLLPCNKGKACRFKRSCFSEEDDAASSAMLLLACVVCAPSI